MVWSEQGRPAAPTARKTNCLSGWFVLEASYILLVLSFFLSFFLFCPFFSKCVNQIINGRVFVFYFTFIFIYFNVVRIINGSDTFAASAVTNF